MVYQFIASSYWAKGIPQTTMQRAIENSLCFGVFTERNQQVGFARVISDYATYAYLADVFILEDHRGKGLSKWLVAEILNHADLQGLRRFNLVTRDAHGLYEQFGFARLQTTNGYMEIINSTIYQQG
ncbi:GNAT family N-acetyltransferase [Cellvibrio sp. KY-GH-1]|uniref:GNAT family N-acetyltransferase n=1 Tax=Cellvibrio sp. KY-GH-1 TaxID=2303332 RepID=UPI001CD91AD9|nr:GNAT family N-acetyltransferase [Cellvibrio sp. KY-GH-1]